MLHYEPWPSELLTAIGVVLALGGISMILFRRQEVRDRQKLYDPTRSWAHPPLWQEHVMTVLGGLLLLGLGILVLVVSLVSEPPRD